MFDKLFKFISLVPGEEHKDKVMENIRANTSFRGSNIWILACAILIACIGLNMNSTAVIIGAMLISPLMGPIVGIGFSLGILDNGLFKKSLKNYLIATLVSMMIASLYFYISPFKDTQSEILARTEPNIYDVLIAFLGGLAGIVALTRVEKGNPIPGVAIATALMPPLCTAGYAIAIQNYNYFLGAIYLYFINSFFIGLATLFIVKFLKYPVKTYNFRYEKHIRLGISILIVIMIVPSIYIAYNLYQEKKSLQYMDNFIHNEFNEKGYTIIFKKTNAKSEPPSIELAFLVKKFKDKEIRSLENKLTEYGLKGVKLIIRQDLRDIKGEILSELDKKTGDLSEKDLEIRRLQQELDKYEFSSINLTEELKTLFPEIKSISIGIQQLYPGTDSSRQTRLCVLDSDGTLKNDIMNRIGEWLGKRIGAEKVNVIQSPKENENNTKRVARRRSE